LQHTRRDDTCEETLVSANSDEPVSRTFMLRIGDDPEVCLWLVHGTAWTEYSIQKEGHWHGAKPIFDLAHPANVNAEGAGAFALQAPASTLSHCRPFDRSPTRREILVDLSCTKASN
jgi:hypothetical protein